MSICVYHTPESASQTTSFVTSFALSWLTGYCCCSTSPYRGGTWCVDGCCCGWYSCGGYCCGTACCTLLVCAKTMLGGAT